MTAVEKRAWEAKNFLSNGKAENKKMWLKQRFKVIIILGRTLAKFNQLVKRNKRFDFIMLVWVQGSLFHIPVHKLKARGHKIVCTGSNSKVTSMLSKTIYKQIPLVITIHKKSTV